MKKMLATIVLLIFTPLFIFNCGEDSEKEILDKFKLKSKIINESCALMNLEPRVYISVIYGELSNNFDHWDRFDDFRAKIGGDPSVGFSQMKVSTFMWIEDNYSDNKLIIKSKKYSEAVDKLINDSTNILYSVFYIKLIQDKFLNLFNSKPSVKNIASYYGKGIDYSNSVIDLDYFNQVGSSAEEFYDSNILIEEYPR